VTGASKGIGAAIARDLAAEGGVVVVNYASSKEDADRVVHEMTGSGGKAIALQADVAKQEEVQRLFLDNNAGVYEFLPLEAVTEEQFHRLFDLNVLGLILASHEVAKQFGPAGGSIINV